MKIFLIFRARDLYLRHLIQNRGFAKLYTCVKYSIPYTFIDGNMQKFKEIHLTYVQGLRFLYQGCYTYINKSPFDVCQKCVLEGVEEFDNVIDVCPLVSKETLL